MKIPKALLPFIAITLILPFSAAAQGDAIDEGAGETGLCSWIWDECSGGFGYHYNSYMGFLQGLNGGPSHNGDPCWFCNSGGQGADPDLCHPCMFAPAPQAYQSLLAAAKAGDVPGMTRWASRVPSRVLINRERSSLQILGCTGQDIIANVVLPERSIALVSASLERSNRANAIRGFFAIAASYVAAYLA